MVGIKRRVTQVLLFSTILIFAVSCSDSRPPTIETTPNQSLVQSYADAYNDHNLDAMSEMMDTNIEWISIEGSKQTIVTGDKETLIQELTSYFASDPTSISTHSDWNVNGKYVSTKETVTFTRKDGSQGSQASISVYEVQSGLIRRVWYFPAE